MEKHERIPLSDASRELGLSEDYVRYQMRKGGFKPPIGRVFKSSSGKTYRYLVYRELLSEYMRGVKNG